MNKEWKVKEKAPEEFFAQFPEHDPRTLQLLWNRGLKTQKEIDEFFNPDYDEDLHDPFLYKGMRRAVGRVVEAIKKEEKILIFGDYDHDGVSGAALLTVFFREIGVENEVYIPDRLKEGYGLSMNSIEEIISRKVKVLITIDCGITDYEEIARAKKAGIDVIVLDHHLPHANLPPAYAIIDAFQADDTYPFKELSGAGVAFKLVQALMKKQNEKGQPRRGEARPTKLGGRMQKVAEGWEKWLLDLVTISTVGDIVPLVGENRTLVKYGLVVLAQTRRPGLKKLMEFAGVKPVLSQEVNPSHSASAETRRACRIPQTNLDTKAVGYMIVPRINAASRMDHADTAFALLTTESEEEAEALARRLEDQNRDRQNLVERIFREVEARLEKDILPPVIVEGDESWSRGVLGIVANKILDKYLRPTFIYSIENGRIVGSARSREGFNVVEAMGSCGNVLEEFGGHEHAGGFTIRNENLEEFKKSLLFYTKKNLGGEGFVPLLDIETELDIEEVGWELFEEIERFEPFGEANPRPVFLIKDLEISDLRPVGQNGKHLQLALRADKKHPQTADNRPLRAIYFNGANDSGHLHPGDKVDIVFELIADEWNGTRELKLKIIDLKPITLMVK